VTEVNLTFSPFEFIEACANPYVSMYADHFDDNHAAMLENALRSCASSGKLRIIDASQIGDTEAIQKMHLVGIAETEKNPVMPDSLVTVYVGASKVDIPAGGFCFEAHDGGSIVFIVFFLCKDGTFKLHTSGSIQGKEMRFTSTNIDPVIGQFISSAYALYRASNVADVPMTEVFAIG
jgi:hypothetical protein